MKIKYTFILIISLLIGKVSSAQKPTCSDKLNVITNIDNTYTAATAQAYYWEIIQGDATITGSNLTRSVEVNCINNGVSSIIKLTRFVNGQCIEACEYLACNEPAPLPDFICFGFDPVTPEHVITSGTLNVAFVNNKITPPVPDTGISFEWHFRFRNSSQVLILNGQNPTFIENQQSNPVMTFGLIVSNGVDTRRLYARTNSNPYALNSQSAYHIPGFGVADISCVSSFHNEYLSENSWNTTKSLKSGSEIIQVYIIKKNQLIQFENIDNDSSYNFKLYNLAGKLVLTSNSIKDGIKISNLKDGIYLYNLTTETGEVIKGKLIKS